MKRPFLLLFALTLAWRTVASTQEEPAAEERSWWDYTQGGLQRGIRAIPGVGDVAGDLLFGSEAAASLQIQKKILQTNTSTLEQIRAMASDALQVKKKIEELNRLRRDALRLAKRLQKTNYLKVLLSLGKDLLRVDVSPSQYVPHTEYTRELKKELHVDLSQEKGVVGQSARLFKQTRKALAMETKKYADYPSFARAVQQATAHDRALELHVAQQQVALAQYYEKLADSLLEANEELKALLAAKEAGMRTAEAVQAYQTISENTQRAAEFKEKACKLLEEAAQLSEADQEALSAEAHRLAAQALVAQEIAWYAQQR